MSVALMGRIWPLSIEPAGRKLVLLAFADAANDDGVTWIALESERGKLDMRQKCSMSPRALRDHVAALVEAGWIERYETAGKGSLWRVHSTPANSAGVPSATPANSAAPPADSAGEPLLNRQCKEKGGERLEAVSAKCPVSRRVLPAGLSLAQWEAFLDMRDAIAKPVRPYVASLVLHKLAEIAKAGWHVGDVVDRSTVNGWADVYEPETGRVTGIRRVAAGQVGEPVGMTEDDKRELIRIADIEDMGERIAARREFMARVERKNAPSPLGAMVGELPLRPPVGKRPR